jgi:hypothetical protein
MHYHNFDILYYRTRCDTSDHVCLERHNWYVVLYFHVFYIECLNKNRIIVSIFVSIRQNIKIFIEKAHTNVYMFWLFQKYTLWKIVHFKQITININELPFLEIYCADIVIMWQPSLNDKPICVFYVIMKTRKWCWRIIFIGVLTVAWLV